MEIKYGRKQKLLQKSEIWSSTSRTRKITITTVKWIVKIFYCPSLCFLSLSLPNFSEKIQNTVMNKIEKFLFLWSLWVSGLVNPITAKEIQAVYVSKSKIWSVRLGHGEPWPEGCVMVLETGVRLYHGKDRL